MKAIIDFVQKNPLVATALLVGIGAILRQIGAIVWDWFLRMFTVTLTVRSTEPAFDWLNIWVTDQKFPIRSVSAGTFYTWRKNEEDNQDGPKVHFTFSNGLHLFKYKGKTMWLWRNELDTKGTLSWRIPEKITIRALGRNSNLMIDFVHETRTHSLNEGRDYVKIMLAEDNSWHQCASQKKRDFSTVVLADNQMTAIIEDVQTFKDHASWYLETGVPYQRGYLFYGPPGTGKTSTVMALASYLSEGIYVLNLNEKEMSDKTLFRLLSAVPAGQIVLLEDVDAVFKERKVGDEDNASHVTFSGLLNAIDGVFTSYGRVLVMTTNHIEKLDPALIRPGRVDKKIYMGYADSEQISSMFRKFFPSASDSELDIYTNEYKGSQVTTAEVQGHLLECQQDMRKAIDTVKDYISKIKPTQSEESASV